MGAPEAAPPAAAAGAEPLLRAYLAAFAVSMFGSGLVFPLTAIYLQSARHASYAAIGAYFLVISVAALIANPVAGRLSDSVNPRYVTAVASAVQATGCVTLALGRSDAAFLAAAALSGMGNGGFHATQMPTLVRLFGRPSLPRIFGSQQVLMNLAVGIGGLAAGGMLTALGAGVYPWLFTVNGASYLVVGLVLLALPGQAPSGAGSAAPRRAGGRAPGAARGPLRDRAFLPLLVMQALFSLFAFAQVEAVLPLVFRTRGGVPVWLVTAFIAANCATVVLVQGQATKITVRVGARRALQAAFVLLTAAMPFGYTAVAVRSLPVQTAALVLFGVLLACGEVFTSPSLRPLVAEIAPPEALGRYSAAISFCYSASLSVAPAASLALLGAAGSTAYFIALAAGLLTGFAVSRRGVGGAAAARPAAAMAER